MIMQKITLEQFRAFLTKLGYTDDMKNSIIAGRAKPKYDNMLKLSKEHGIPFEAWQDIRAWLGLPPTRTQLKLREQACKNSNIKS